MQVKEWAAAAGIALGLLSGTDVARADTYGVFPRQTSEFSSSAGSSALSASNRTMAGSLRTGQSVSYQIVYAPGTGADGGVAPWLLSLRASANPAYPGAVSFTVTDSNGAIVGTSAPAAPYATPDVADPSTDVSGIVNGYFSTLAPGPLTVTVSNWLPGSINYTLTLFPS